MNTRPMHALPTETEIRAALSSVVDPEIPVVNILEMGILAAIRIDPSGVFVDLTPTFAACPAMDIIREEARRAVSTVYDGPVTTRITYDPPWTSDRLTPEGRRKLEAFGLAPPRTACPSTAPGVDRTERPAPVPCPFCRSTNTEMESLFGPTLCRAIHYCHACLQSFEHFKEV